MNFERGLWYGTFIGWSVTVVVFLVVYHFMGHC